MYRYLFGGLLIILFAAACGQKKKSSTIINTKDSVVKSTSEIKNYTDTTAVLFKDTSYRVNLRFINPDQQDSIANTVLMVSHKGTMLLKDSLYCPFAIFDLKDMNGDNVKDLLIVNNSSARSNEGFYLYLTDTINKKLIRVAGFEKILNPSFDTENNIIHSSALWGGSETCGFYRINKQNKLIDLGFGFDHLVDEDKLYDRAIKRIIKKWGRK